MDHQSKGFSSFDKNVFLTELIIPPTPVITLTGVGFRVRTNDFQIVWQPQQGVFLFDLHPTLLIWHPN